MKKQVEFSIEDSFKKLQKSLEGIGPALEQEINAAVKDAAYAAYASIVAKAQAELNTTREDYLSGLQFIDLGNNEYVITLNGERADSIEDGYPSYNLVPGLLKSTKTVEVGQRAGQSWVQQSQPKGKNKETHKYAHVPLERKVSSVQGTSNLADAIRSMTATNARGRQQKITSLFKDGQGNPIQGKVAVGRSDDPMLDQLVKYQKTTTNPDTGKSRTQSVYINYRTISENGKPWIHKGYAGLHAFEDAEKEIEKQLDNIIRTLLG